MKNVLKILKDRGLLDASTSNEVMDIVEKPLRFYIGFDPTADSLHIGNLVGMMVAAWFQKCGHTPVLIVGGATGMIGDPSGRSMERNLLDAETLEKNLQGIKRSLSTVLDTKHVLNNYEWFKDFGFISFLRDVGKHFRLGPMLAKESVKVRLNSEEGLSFTEFSYQLLQAYDFLYLFDHHGVTLQLGGSDQWGNITAGTELVRKMRGKSVHGVTFPLLTRSDGKKFGKSEEGTIWMNSDRLGPYDFYQYFVRVPDADVIKLLKVLTFLELDEIQQIENEMKGSIYVHNSAQKRLASEVTKIVHGEEGLQMALKITENAAPGAKTKLDLSTLEELAKEHKAAVMPLDGVVGAKFVDLLVKVEGATSKGEARRLIQNGGVYLNNEKILDEHYMLEMKDLIERKFLLIAVGKKKKIVIKIG